MSASVLDPRAAQPPPRRAPRRDHLPGLWPHVQHPQQHARPPQLSAPAVGGGGAAQHTARPVAAHAVGRRAEQISFPQGKLEGCTGTVVARQLPPEVMEM